jgi:hypothetical protein
MKDLTTVTVSHNEQEITVGFISHPTMPGAFAPVVNGHPLVKAPSLKGNVLQGSLVPYFTTADERTALKAVRALGTGRWAAVEGLLTKGGAFRKGFEATAAAASDSLKIARESRKAAMDERKAEKAAVKAAAPKAPKKAKAKAKAAKAAKTVETAIGDAGLMRFMSERESVIAHLTGAYPMAATTVAMAYGIPVGIVESLAAQIAAKAAAAA